MKHGRESWASESHSHGPGHRDSRDCLPELQQWGDRGPEWGQAPPKVRQPSWAQAPHKPHKPGQSWCPGSHHSPFQSLPTAWWGWEHLAFPVCLGRAQAKPEGRHRDLHSPVTQELGLHQGGRDWVPHPGSDSLKPSSAGCPGPNHSPSLLLPDFSILGIYRPTIQGADPKATSTPSPCLSFLLC